MKAQGQAANNQSNGLYLPNNRFIRFDEARRGAYSESVNETDSKPSRHSLAQSIRSSGRRSAIATRARMSGLQLTGNLPNPDPVLKEKGLDITEYRKLLAEPRIGGNVRRRKAAVLSLERGIDAGDAPNHVVQFIEDWLNDIDMERLVRELMDAPLYGYQPVELLWQPIGLRAVPVEILGKPPEWFKYDAENRLRFMAQDAGVDGELCDPNRFIVARQDATYINPYGFADLSMCYWAGTFLRSGLLFWVQFTERYGTPWVVGKSPRGTEQRESEQLLSSLEQMVQDAIAVIPEDDTIDIIEAAGKSASTQVHQAFLEYCRSDINVALLGQDQTTDKDTNHASATAGAEVAAAIRDGDTSIVLSAINRIIRLVVDVNFGESVAAPKYEMWEQERVDKLQAERDQILAAAGLRFTPAYWQRTYGLEEDDIDTTPMAWGHNDGAEDASSLNAFNSTRTGFEAFAESPRASAQLSDPSEPLTEKLTDSTQPAVDEWLKQIGNIVKNAADLSTLQNQIVDNFSDLSEDELSEVMGIALTAAQLAGQEQVRASLRLPTSNKNIELKAD